VLFLGLEAPCERSTGPWRSGVIRPRPTELTGRSAERAALERLVEAVKSGESRALVVRGDPGVGKTVLLDYLAARAAAAGCRVERAAGVQTEMTLPFAGLHQLCAPMADHLDRIPAPQRDALRTAFGLAAGPPPDRFLVGLAVLSLLCDVAGKRPLICVIDDEQWLDQASAQALGFVARRLAADPVGVLFAAREPGDALTGLPELQIQGLPDDEARALLDAALGGPLDVQVRDLIVAETHGNPLALLELPRGMTTTELAGGFGLLGARSGAGLPGRIEGSFRRQLEALPTQTQRLLLLAAAEPYGDLSLVWRAADRLGIGAQAATPALEAGLVEFGARVRFRHPLLRSTAYQAASVQDRQQVHRTLAEVTDPDAEPDRRAWHRAKAAPGPDEEVAAELERSAGRAQARGGLAAAAAFLERAVLLTVDPARRAERTLAAAQANLQAGAFGPAMKLLATAEAGPLDELQSARVDLLRGEIVFASGLGSDAPPLLLKAAKRLEPLDDGLARETYLTAWMAALFAGQLAGAGDLLEVSRAARNLPPPTTGPAGSPRAVDLVLDGLALVVTDGLAAAAPTLRQVVTAFSGAPASAAQAAGAQNSSALASVGDELRWGWLAQAAASALWDDDAWRAMLARQLRLARGVGALERLPILLGALGTAVAWSGDFAAATSLVAEADAVNEATGSRAAPFAAMLLAALRGHQAEATSLIEATIAEATAGGQGIAVAYAHWVAAILANGLGRYEEALAAATAASEDTSTVYMSMWALPELVEAAARCGNTDLASRALGRLADRTQAGGTDFGLGILARSRALLSEGRVAEERYREAIDRLGRTRLRPELARAHLLYGEWLRRENRRVDARAELRAAHNILDPIGMEAFAERARHELAATGETVRRRTPDTLTTLTAQEAHIARLAAEGQTNSEIGAQLFISARTVEWHLRKIFAKLGVGSRRELGQALAGVGPIGEVDHARSENQKETLCRTDRGLTVPVPAMPRVVAGRPGLDQLLAAVDVVGRPGHRGVGHQVHGQRGDVGRPDHPPDGQRGAQLGAARLQVSAQQPGRQGRVDEAGRDAVDPDRGEFQGQVGHQGGYPGGADRRDGLALGRAPGAGAAHEQQRAAGPDLAHGVLADPQRHQQVPVQGPERLGEVQLGQRCVVRSARGHVQVVDRLLQAREEPVQGGRVGDVEGRRVARADLGRGLLQVFGVTAGQDDLGALLAGQAGRFQAHARAAADHQDRLTSKFRGPSHDATLLSETPRGPPRGVAAPRRARGGSRCRAW